MFVIRKPFSMAAGDLYSKIRGGKWTIASGFPEELF